MTTNLLPLLSAFLGCAASAGASSADDTAFPADTASAGTLGISPGTFVLRGATLLTPSGPIAEDLEVRGGRIHALGGGSPGVTVVDVSGRWIAPAFIDSHVHLAYLPEGGELADHGVAGAVDMAAPEGFLATRHAPLRVLASGPMVTAVGGYPTQGWGRDGYGLECADAAAAVAAVDHLVDAGARLIKLPVTAEPGEGQLDASALAAAVAEAHGRGVLVASHALSDDEAARAAAAGVDVLAHTPTASLSPSTLAAWSGKAVVTTLVAFGNSATTRANLAALISAGVTPLYGTDFGNARDAAINATEVQGMLDAGMSGQAVLDAGTSVPAALWGFDDLGTLAVGMRASLLVIDADPRQDPLALTRPVMVYIDGQRRESSK